MSFLSLSVYYYTRTNVRCQAYSSDGSGVDHYKQEPDASIAGGRKHIRREGYYPPIFANLNQLTRIVRGVSHLVNKYQGSGGIMMAAAVGGYALEARPAV